MVSIITVNYNQKAMTLDMLQSVFDQVQVDVEVIVVDNASKEDPGPAILQAFPTVKYIRSNKNLGFAKANNLGIEQSSGDYLFFVNNDTELTAGLTKKLVDYLAQNQNVAAVSPLICYFPEGKKGAKDIIQFAGTTPLSKWTGRNRTIGQYEVDTGQFATPVLTAYAHGAAMMVPKKIVDELGPWPTEFFLYYEELDWCAQMKKAGYDIAVVPTAKIYHKESLTIGAESPLKVFYINRNRVLFMRRNFSFIGALPYFVFLWFVTYPKNIIMYLIKGKSGLMKAFSRGIWWNFFPNRIGDPYLPK